MTDFAKLKTNIEKLIDAASDCKDGNEAMKFTQAATNASQAMCMLRDVESALPLGLDIKHMVDRFLSWKLPANFSPDGGITFKPIYNEGTKHEGRHEPSGTNLLNATQATEMVRHMVAGLA